MNAANVSLINALLLIILPLFGYFLSDNPSSTAFIPVGFGVVIAAMNPGIRKHNKVIAHIAVLITLLVFGALFAPLMSAFKRGDTAAVIRVSLMLFSSLWAMMMFIKSFIDARKARKAAEAESE
ncbi:MAG: hypothetical protein AAF483_16245 [Planctomycetota bacterium]